MIPRRFTAYWSNGLGRGIVDPEVGVRFSYGSLNDWRCAFRGRPFEFVIEKGGEEQIYIIPIAGIVEDHTVAGGTAEYIANELEGYLADGWTFTKYRPEILPMPQWTEKQKESFWSEHMPRNDNGPWCVVCQK